jgi:nicotinamide-nucleotide amidase
VAQDPDPSVEHIGELLEERGTTLAIAESLTGGELSARFACAPGASDWFRGGVVAYSSEVKHSVLDVPPGPVVSEASARAMADRVVELLGADIALAVTGAAGPEAQDGQPPGTVWMGLVDGTRTRTRLEHFDGSPAEVVDRTLRCAIDWLHDRLRAET